MLSPHDHADIVTLVDLLRRRIGEPADLGFRFLAGRESASATLSFAELDRRARAVAVALQEHNLAGERALLCYPPGLEFLVGLFGSLYAGLVAVPAYPPRAHKPDARLASMLRCCRPAIVLTSTDLVADRDKLVASMPEFAAIPWLASDAVNASRLDEWRPVQPSPDDLAILQYTSGSTGDPKGVMLTHACVLHNIAGISHAMKLGRGSIGVSWLPAFHDMGLIGNLLGVIWFPGCLHVLSPLAVLQDPFRWLDAVSRTRAYISGGPCFAFEQCLKRITPEQRKQLDLSAWRLAYVGAEPISARILDEFARTFAECGFRPEYLYPCFGLAESSLMVTGVEAGTGPLVRTFDGSALEKDRAHLAEKGRVLVGSGKAIIDLDVRIVDPSTNTPIANGHIGEVWVHGPSVAAGYFERPEETESTFGAVLEGKRWLRTGDLGFFHEEQLFIAGRLKDVLIIRGRNYYPQDIEEIVQFASPLLKSSGGAAFTQEDDRGARLVLVYEVPRNYKPGQSDVFACARSAIAEEFGIELSELVLIRASTLPRTSSGKVARRETMGRFLAGDLDIVERFTQPVEPVESESSTPASSSGTIHAWLVDRLARQLGIDRLDIDPEKPFASYGLDSLAMVRIAGELERWLDRPLSPTLLYSAPTIASLSRVLGTASPGNEAIRQADNTDSRIAIVGIGCRFPGADGPEAFWQLLREGRSAIRDLPEGRWTSHDRDVTTTRGGYLDEVKGFDAGFFGLSAREAPWLDPQHRLLLETAYHALEDAGLAIDQLAGSAVGVFVGISSNDYGKLLSEHAGAEMYLATGNAASMAAHRLSYHLDLHGPSLAIDTACSSSLTAVHYACQAMRNGECNLALVAGVNLILTPDITEALSRAQMLSPEARCKTFDSSADGYVRGEGVGVVVLKPLVLALRDGDPLYAVIEATAVNQDGKSNGITAPNGAAQVALVRQALARAGRSPAALAFIETHGTGTSLGDPIEFDALREALGDVTVPCSLGAVKTNIGHLEAAAGIAGLIKTALQLHHGQIAPLVGLEQVNPLIRVEGSRFRLPRDLVEWPRGRKARVAGVSSFGFGGSNAHVLLSEAPTTNLPVNPSAISLIPLSARTESALADLASRVAAFLRTHDVPLADVAHTLALGRTHQPHRLVVHAQDRTAVVSSMEHYAKTGRDPLVQTGKAAGNLDGRIAFLFTGQGSAYPGMARAFELYEVFRTTLDRCEAIVRSLAGWSVRQILADANRIEETEFAQPTLFAFEVALAELWRSWGIEPSAVLGHSVGEYVAAHLAGVLSLKDGLKLIVERGRLMQGCPAGAMLACLASVEQVRGTVERYGKRVAIAANNGPRQCVVSGDAGAIAAVAMELTEQRIENRVLRVRRAFHSPLIEPALDGLRASATSIIHFTSKIVFISNVTGEILVGPPPSDYWARHARSPVQFEASIQTLHQLGITHFIEVGPAAVLSRLGATVPTSGSAVWLASSTGEKDDGREILRSVARLHVDGATLAWSRLITGGRRIRLPGYPFQHRTYWLDDLPRTQRIVQRPAHEVPGLPVSRAWRPRSHWAQQLPRHTPVFPALTAIVDDVVDTAWAEHPLADAVQLRPEFDRLAGLYIVAAFDRLGWRPIPGETTPLGELASRLSVVPHKSRLFQRMIQLAAEDGWLEQHADTVQVHCIPSRDDPAQVHANLLLRYPDFEVELRLANHCARHLAGVLQGTVDPLQILFEGEAGKWTSEIYSRAPVARFYNALLTRSVSRLIDVLPTDRPLHILELGAGTGGTTQALLPTMPTERTEYLFTDVSSLFLARAREQFSHYYALDYRMFDLENDDGQGLAAGQFDLVIASNVLHATSDLRKSLRQARRLLVPGGLLVLLEGTGPRRLLDLIFGLTEGWWKFQGDGVRAGYPLIAPSAWWQLLVEEGFDSIVALPDGDARLPDPDQVVILARLAVTTVVPERTRSDGRWLVVGDDTPLSAALVEQLTVRGAQVVHARAEEVESIKARLLEWGMGNEQQKTNIVLLPSHSALRTLELPGGVEPVWRVTVGAWPTGEEGMPIIDLDPGHSPDLQASILVEALTRPGSETIVVYRGDQRYVPTVSSVESEQDENGPEIEAPDRAVLVAASPFERRALVEGYLRQELARLLGASLSDEDLDMPVQSLGLDSLMAIQVRNRVEMSLGVALSLVDFLKGLRVRQLVENILDQLSAEPARIETVERTTHRSPVVDEPVGDLSEPELDSLLVSLLDSDAPDAS